ncbi:MULTISPECIES: hypothetical protein [unclassified Streptomyces]|uniref:hypothetical protein n=1 Tax=unclassified Streptomyces TaxID=2593676 RepID=UPI0006AF9B2A|nr:MULTISPECIES: hypothetical protein [unclassified Streptomyces]KOX16569.1 hypothetical protein ADL06_33250 [Streptomyces sp. NRRL F-6491]KOX36103.1 hypothetical protein ADL08_33490 [Streptomyces sp. NRRL F-6492]
MRYEITAPHDGDEQIADLTLTDGRGTATGPSEGLLLYLRRHGYIVDPVDETNAPPDDDKPAGRSAARKTRG